MDKFLKQRAIKLNNDGATSILSGNFRSAITSLSAAWKASNFGRNSRNDESSSSSSSSSLAFQQSSQRQQQEQQEQDPSSNMPSIAVYSLDVLMSQNAEEQAEQAPALDAHNTADSTTTCSASTSSAPAFRQAHVTVVKEEDEAEGFLYKRPITIPTTWNDEEEDIQNMHGTIKAAIIFNLALANQLCAMWMVNENDNNECNDNKNNNNIKDMMNHDSETTTYTDKTNHTTPLSPIIISSLQKAIRLYECGITLNHRTKQPSLIFLLATFNNLSQIYQLLDNEDKSDECCQRLLKVLFLLIHHHHCTITTDLTDFFQTISQWISPVSTRPAAAA